MSKEVNRQVQISEAEWQVMKVLWQRRGLTAAQVYSEVTRDNSWSDGTVRTYLRRLVEKGAVRFEQDKTDSRIYYYFPVIDEKSALETESKSFLRRIISGKVGLVLASLIQETDLSEKEISELEEILKQRRGKNI